MRFILLLIPFLLFGNSLDRELQNLSTDQKKILVWVYEKAEPYDLKWTMMAIAWQESSFGKYLIGRTSPDYGIFQVNINSFERRYSNHWREMGVNFDREQVAYYLINDKELNFVASLEEILFWRDIHNGNWNKIWASYNGGYKGNFNYAQKIKAKIRALKRFLTKNSIMSLKEEL